MRSDPWPTGRRKAEQKPTPSVPGRPLVLRSYHRPPPPPVDLSAPRPPVVDDTSLIGFSRVTRSRLGSRVYRLVVAAVFVLIFVQMVFALFRP